jgi:hypothetical protein
VEDFGAEMLDETLECALLSSEHPPGQFDLQSAIHVRFLVSIVAG